MALATQTGSYPAVVPRVETEAQRALRIALESRAEIKRLKDVEIGHPPVEDTDDPGAGMWRVLSEVRRDCKAILARLNASDAASGKWTSRAARVGWRVLETVVTLAVAALLAWASGHWK